jgi:hypothetical protein
MLNPLFLGKLPSYCKNFEIQNTLKIFRSFLFVASFPLLGFKNLLSKQLIHRSIPERTDPRSSTSNPARRLDQTSFTLRMSCYNSIIADPRGVGL